MLGVKPVSVTECEVTRLLLRADCEPYVTVVPKETCVVAVWSVVQVMVADVAVMPEAVTEVITGAGGGAAVAKVKFDEVVDVPALFAEIAA